MSQSDISYSIQHKQDTECNLCNLVDKLWKSSCRKFFNLSLAKSKALEFEITKIKPGRHSTVFLFQKKTVQFANPCFCFKTLKVFIFWKEKKVQQLWSTQHCLSLCIQHTTSTTLNKWEMEVRSRKYKGKNIACQSRLNAQKYSRCKNIATAKILLLFRHNVFAH